MTDSNEKYLSDRQVAERYSISRHTAWRWTKEGALPKPVKIRSSTRWRLSDLLRIEQSLSDSR